MSGAGRQKAELREAREESAKRGERITEMEGAHLRLQHLYEISKLLTHFQGVERTVPEVIDAVARTVPLCNAIFILEASRDGAPWSPPPAPTAPRIIAWQAAGESGSGLRVARAHAQLMYGHLARSSVDLEHGEIRVLDLPPRPAEEPCPEPRAPPGKSFILLPLVVGHGSIFGALQIEGSAPLLEVDLVFVNAVVNQLAIAVDREAIIAAELGRRDAAALENARLYEEARRATRARDDVLAVVSHDLRNLLSVILMSLTVLMRDPEDDPKKTKKVYAGMQRSAERMKRLIADLLDTASIEAGRLAIEQRRHPVAPLVSEALASAEPLAADKSVCLESRLSAELLEVFVDAARLQQVLANLLGNAIKFTPAGGTIAVAARPGGGAVTFSVTDTGSGIGEAELPHVFDRFWQARKTAHFGTGLGLFVTKGIVEAHGGTVWVESRAGEGSTFYFTLPVAPPGVDPPVRGRRSRGGKSRPDTRAGGGRLSKDRG